MKYKLINHDGAKLRDIGINDDGTLHNPSGYPTEIVRAAVLAADERRRVGRSASAKKAAETRHRRTELRVSRAALKLANGESSGPSSHCVICGRALDDHESIDRGIGSECWQYVLSLREWSSISAQPSLFVEAAR